MSDSLLIIDGCPDRRIRLKRQLASAHYGVLTASNGAEGLHLAAAALPSVIVAESMLPDMSVLTFCEQVRRNEGMETVGILLIDPAPEPRISGRFYLQGADDVVSQSVCQTRLVSIVRNLFRRQRELQNLARRLFAAGLGFVPPTSDGQGGYTPDDCEAWLVTSSGQTLFTRRNELTQAAGLERLKTTTPPMAQKLFSMGYKPDLVVLDLSSLDFGAALKLISDHNACITFCRAELIVVTTPNDDMLAAVALDLGASMTVPADVSPDLLAIRLAAVNRRKRQTDAYWAQVDVGLKLTGVDPLTGLANRRAGLFAIERMLDDCARKQKPMALLMLDLDGLKSVNDQFGHSAGDAVLSDLSARIADHLPADAILSRFGGDEFVVALPRASTDEALLIAERVRLAVESMPVELPDDIAVTLSLSMGLVQSEVDASDTVACLLQAADHQMYAAKNRGRNRVCVGLAAA